MLLKENLTDESNRSLPSFHKSPNGLTTILVSVVILAIVGIGGYTLGARQRQSLSTKPLTKPESSPLPTATPFQQLSASPTIPTSQAVPPSEWKVYQSEKYAYSIAYPNIFEPPSNRKYEGIGGVVEVEEWVNKKEAVAINVFSYANGVNPRLEFNLPPLPEETISLNGQNVRKLISLDETLIHIGPFRNKGQNHVFIYTASPGHKVNNSVFYQMLSTLTFN